MNVLKPLLLLNIMRKREKNEKKLNDTRKIIICLYNCLMHFDFLLVSFFVMLLSLIFLIYFLTETGRIKQTRKNNVIYYSIGLMLFISIIASFTATNNDSLFINILINIYSFAVLSISFFLSKAKIEEIKEYQLIDASSILKIHRKSIFIIVNIILSNGILYWFGFSNLLQTPYLMVYFAISFLIHVFLILKLDYSSKRLKIVF